MYTGRRRTDTQLHECRGRRLQESVASRRHGWEGKWATRPAVSSKQKKILKKSSTMGKVGGWESSHNGASGGQKDACRLTLSGGLVWGVLEFRGPLPLNTSLGSIAAALGTNPPTSFLPVLTMWRAEAHGGVGRMLENGCQFQESCGNPRLRIGCHQTNREGIGR